MSLLKYLLLLLYLVSSASFVRPLCHDDERSALLQFKESFVVNSSAFDSHDAYPKTNSWEVEGESADCCSWDGVECDNNTGHVIGLDLGSSYLYGSINSSSSLFRLVHLQRLSLAENFFNNSRIPSEIRTLSKLTSLDLRFSNFSGEIPSEIFELSHLEYLDLSWNLLKLQKQGFYILAEKLTKLSELYLSDVKISSTVPAVLANWSSLAALILKNCSLHGELPTGIFQLPNLKHLSLELNPDLAGYIPNIHGSYPLMELSLANTNFSGRLPESIGKLKSLQLLDINNCRFEGSIPTSIGNLTNLNYLDLSHNNFSGPIPHLLGNLNQLDTSDLSFNKFVGEIPSSLANLSQLTYLSLSTNNFSPRPLSWLGKQIKLNFLDLTKTNLYGNIPPSVRNLTKISELYLGCNQLDGQIPTWIGNLTHITLLKLQENKLVGPIPQSISRLENLTLLDLQSSFLNGSVKFDLLVKAKKLIRLQLSGNNLSLTNVNINFTLPKFKLLGLASCNLIEFPNFLRCQDELEFLELANNNIQGKIPKWIWTIGIETLSYLDVAYNFLTGFEELPAVLPWKKLTILDLRSNKLHGSVPNPPPSVITYFVSNNSLTGEISPMFCNLSSPVVLEFSNNNLSGMLPPCLANLSASLKVLNFQNNHFTSDIPQTYVRGCSLRMINFAQNQLQGKVPRSLAYCTMLEALNLGKNQINDTFPSWLGVLPNLKVLVLRSNRLHGVIGKPQSSSEFSKLQIIDISDNNLGGELPLGYFNIWNAMKVFNAGNLSYMNATTGFQSEEFSWSDYYRYSIELTNKGVVLEYESVQDSFTAIDLSNNTFNGEIHENIGNLKALNMLNLSNNNLTGHIPSSLASLTHLESLELSRNKLSGEIPRQLVQLTFLSFFDVSHNRLKGPIPVGRQFSTFDTNSFLGNLGLCGSPLPKKCGIPDKSSGQDPLNSEEDKGIGSLFTFDWKVVLVGFAAGLIIGMPLGCKFINRKHGRFLMVLGNKQLRRREKQRRHKCCF